MALELRNQIWHYRFMLKGAKFSGSTHTSNRRAAAQIESKAHAAAVQDMVLDNIRPTDLHAAIQKFVDARPTPASKRNARITMGHFKKSMPNKPLKKVELHEVENVIQIERNRGMASSTIALRTNIWNSFHNWCKTQKYPVPPRLKQTGVMQGKIRWLTLEEQAKLLDAVLQPDGYISPNAFKDEHKQNNWDLTVFLLDTGVRYNEAANIQTNQIDLKKRELVIRRSKGGRDTVMSMSTRLHTMLSRRIQEIKGDYIFPKLVGKNQCSKWFQPAVKRAELSTVLGAVTPHTCRHTFASMMLQNGLSLPEVSHLLGHKTVAMTAKYAHFVKQDAANKSVQILNALQAEQAALQAAAAAPPVKGLHLVA